MSGCVDNENLEGITKKTLLESIRSGNEYIEKLGTLNVSIEAAKQQVTNTSKTSKIEIETTFEKLQSILSSSLVKRKEELLEQVKSKEEKGLNPLNECEILILKKLKEAKDFIDDAKNIMKAGGVTSSEQCCNFLENSSLIGTLPAVPDLEIVPDITFHCNIDTHISDINKYINSIGKISKMGPVQLSEFIMKPGGLLIKWEEVDTEFQGDDQIFKLQMAHDDIRTKLELQDTNFHDIYIGTELEHLVRNLNCNVSYTFRICVETDETGGSAWSLLKVAHTNIPPLSWENNSDYLVTNDNKIATKISSEYTVLYSNGAQLNPFQSVEFTILDCVNGLCEEGLALCISKHERIDCIDAGVLFVNTSGKIYIDGVIKLTVLPEFTKGAKVIFNCEDVSKNGLRVHIESKGKAVTYYWKINVESLYFAAVFLQPGFKVAVA